MGVELGGAEHLVDPLDQPLADRVLQSLRLVVHLPQLQADDLVQEGLQQAVAAHDVERGSPPLVGELDPAARLPLEQLGIVETTDHARDRRRRDVQRRGERGRADTVLHGEGEDPLQVVLDGHGRLHASDSRRC